MSEQQCKRCGDPEFRIDGYCSVYCRDLAEAEDELNELQDLYDEVAIALEERGYQGYANKSIGEILDNFDKSLDHLVIENEKLRQALEVYANEDNWLKSVSDGGWPTWEWLGPADPSLDAQHVLSGDRGEE